MKETGRDPSEIKAGIERARAEIEQSVAELRQNVSQTLDWRNAVRKRPGIAFGAAMAVGFLIARATTR